MSHDAIYPDHKFTGTYLDPLARHKTGVIIELPLATRNNVICGISLHNKEESRLRLWNIVLQSTSYKKNLFQSKYIEWETTGKLG